MTFAAREISRYFGKPFELFLFSTTGASYYYTSADRAITYNSKTYSPLPMKRTEVDQNSEAKSGAIKVTIPRTSDIAGLFVAFIPESPLSLVIYKGHTGDPDNEVVVEFTGSVISAEFDDHCTLVCAPEQELLKRRVPVQQFLSMCPWVLYGAGCNLNKDNFRVTGTVSSVSSVTVQAAVFATKPDGWFRSGYLEYGNQRRLIVAHVGNTVTLVSQMMGLANGASIFAYAGCNRTESDCKNKFNNFTRFWGFTHIPNQNPFGVNGIL